MIATAFSKFRGQAERFFDLVEAGETIMEGGVSAAANEPSTGFALVGESAAARG